MKNVKLTGTDLTVSRLCLGTVNFGNPLNQDQVSRNLDLFLEHGGNFVDTAHVYSNWLPGTRNRSERMLGEWMKGGNRDRIVLSTKGGHFDFADPSVSRVLPEEIRRDIAESLDCLGTDRIDLYFLHRDNTALDVSEIMDCLFEIQDSGAVRWLGCSNWTADRIAAANAYARKKGRAGFAVDQLMWSMAKPNRSALPRDYIVMDENMQKVHQKDGMSVMCFTSQARGYFTKLRLGKEMGRDMTDVYQNEENDRLYREKLAGLTPSEVTKASLRYFEDQDPPAVPIVSCNSEQQLLECMAAFE